ncbi:PAS domain S-box-containing protein/HDIG domain-containing protein [Maridesulfovibrio ferrireducens]|uniref:PAS domain S-box-containing protein/HDIG domain-containing protein n=1 Tax=Maridesulfovibrio ferrireducens TaxID=246191 RepID=A0A1G9CIL0_9BACT|nr:HD domain-containing protein [Maridesulfovibrio ferrireducens]SDK51304.1 PAS domain S-box-containing protein/HDIG domain-containing protein [Maridesulfovibrio ferrireducens]
MIPYPEKPEASNQMPRVLIVEDEAIVALDIKSRLVALGYIVVGIASNGITAIEMALHLAPDLILMDIMLEGDLDGIDAAKAISGDCSIPVIYITAYADNETLKRAKITEPFGYIIKPFEDRELNLTIEIALYKHKTECSLKENRRWLKTTFESIGDAVITTDQNGIIKSVNKTASLMLESSPEDLFAKNFSEEINMVDSSTFKPISLLTNFRSEPEKTLLIENIALKTKTKTIPVSVNISKIQDKNIIMGTVIIFRDISQIKESEVALKNSLKRLRRTFDETVAALATMSEKRDPYTSGHQQRVAELASRIAAKLHLPVEKIHCIKIAGILHDVGKISIPAEILSKPTRLTDLEMSLVKTHPEIGYEILKGISFPWPVADIVRQHHERLDGTGYPDGLSEKLILPESKIIAVADVVEAMSSHRPYRPALGFGKAIAEIVKGRGIIYDADVVDACIDIIENETFSFGQ